MPPEYHEGQLAIEDHPEISMPDRRKRGNGFPAFFCDRFGHRDRRLDHFASATLVDGYGAGIGRRYYGLGYGWAFRMLLCGCGRFWCGGGVGELWSDIKPTEPLRPHGSAEVGNSQRVGKTWCLCFEVEAAEAEVISAQEPALATSAQELVAATLVQEPMVAAISQFGRPTWKPRELARRP